MRLEHNHPECHVEVATLIDKGHMWWEVVKCCSTTPLGVVGVRLVSSDVTRGWLQPCATSELSVVGACRALDQASRAHEKKYRPCREPEMLERGSGSLGFASWVGEALLVEVGVAEVYANEGP